MDYLDRPVLIEEWKQNLDSVAYENNINQYVKLTSMNSKKQIVRNDKTEYCPTSINGSLYWLPIFEILELATHSIQNDKNAYRNF